MRQGILGMRTLAAAALAALMTVGGAAAQDYPARTITMIVPFPPGGGNDVIGRIMAEELAKRLGQSVIVENVPGANGSIGLQRLKESEPDGYTIGVAAAGPMAVNPHLYNTLTYDPVADFAPISNMVMFPLLLVARDGFEATTIPDLIAYAKAHPGELTYASPGIGNSGHLAGELLDSMAETEMVHVPYNGNGPAVTDLLGGHVDLLFSSIPSVIQHVTDGALVPIAIGSAERLPALADVPTVAESGVAGYEAYSWVGLVAPAGTPAELVGLLNSEVRTILEDPAVSERLSEQGAVPDPTTAEEFGRYIEAEIAKWGAVVAEAGIPKQ